MSFSHSLGSMETWEPEDKSFSKHRLRKGCGDVMPNIGSECVVHILLIGEEETDASLLGSYKFGEDVDVTLGEGDALLADHLDNVVLTMQEDEFSYIKSVYSLNGNKVGLSSTSLQQLPSANSKSGFKFNIHLKSFSRVAELSDLEFDERLERAQNDKDRGTALFRENKLDYAMKRYQRAIKYLLDVKLTDHHPDHLLQQQVELKCQCHLNLAACYLKLEMFEEVVDHCTQALALDGTNVKGRFRRGQAFVKLCTYDKAREDFKQALKVEPENKALINQIRNLDSLIKKEKQVYQRMFNS